MSEEVKPHDISQEIWMEALELQRNLTGNRADCISLSEFDDNTVTLARALVSARASSQAEIARLREALRKLAAEVGGLRTFESELRAELGNTNWSVLMLRLSEAEAALSETRSDG